MEALFQIVGCVVSSRPAAERIDELVAQVRRERAIVMTKDALGTTFMRLSAPDTRLVTLACQAVLAQTPSPLRFGFAAGSKDAGPTPQDGTSVSNRILAQAADLAAGARDGEVLVTPQLAVLLIEAGVALHTRLVHLADGRILPACSLSLAAPSAEGKLTDALDSAYRALAVQADEVARKQADLEARLADALEKTALVEQGSRLAAHLGELEAELDAQLLRVHERLQFIDALEGRVAGLVQSLESSQRSIAAFEARLSELDRSAEAVEQKVLSRADAVTHMLSDINVNLEMLSEQRSVIDHVGEKLARLDFTVQEAQNTLRALQREREVAERIEQGIKALRSRGSVGKLSPG